MDEKKLIASSKRRCIISVLLVLAVMVGLILRLMDIQLVHGEEYLSAAGKTSTRTIAIEAPRGEIQDSAGRSLATNKTVYCIGINVVFMPSKDKNDILLNLINIMEAAGETYYDELPVTLAFPYSFPEGTDTARRRIKGAFGLKSTPESANILMVELKKRYKIPSTYTEEEARKVCGVRYTMELRGASTQVSYVFARGISTHTVTTVKENSAVLPGCDIITKAERIYNYSDCAADIVGIVGAIDADELAERAESNYSATDMIGKFGIEKSMEGYLRGTPGEMQVVLNSRGQVISSSVTKEPIPGATVVLTIDIELQKQACKLLEETVADIASTYKGANGGDCNAGSLVLTDVNTGAIIAAANYPTYDLNAYFSSYSELLMTDGNPLFNRAFSGLYPPGSTFKPITAFAGLETGTINSKTTFTCRRTYKYLDRDYHCTGYHGAINVVTAIAKSCNIFCYQLAEQTGFEPIQNVARDFGFAGRTGVEITDAVGSISSQNLLMTAIGQADTLVTPLQLSRYMAAMANGGTVYRSTLVKAVVSYDFKRTILPFVPEVVNKLDYKKSSWELVTDGLYSGVNRKQASYYTAFAGTEYKVASKTGTAEIPSGSSNGMFICYAPYDNPQVALSVALEHAGSGSRCAPLARKLLDIYFSSEDEF